MRRKPVDRMSGGLFRRLGHMGAKVQNDGAGRVVKHIVTNSKRNGMTPAWSPDQM